MKPAAAEPIITGTIPYFKRIIQRKAGTDDANAYQSNTYLRAAVDENPNYDKEYFSRGNLYLHDIGVLR